MNIMKNSLRSYEKIRRKISHKPFQNLDFYSIIHFLYGVLAYKLNLDIYTSILLAVSWEIIEQYYFIYVDNEFKLGPAIQDDFIHCISDIIYMIMGFYFTNYFWKRNGKIIGLKFF